MERLIDYAAAEMRLRPHRAAPQEPDPQERDPVQVRRRHHLRQRRLPGDAQAGARGRRLEGLQQAQAREQEARQAARHRRRLLSSKSPRRPTRKWAASRFDADGGVTILTGTLDYGQGHATPFAQVLSEQLGVPFEKVRLLQGDSDELLAGGGTGGSRSMMNSGQAIVEAAAKVVEQGKQIASHALEASAGDIEFKDGKFVVAGTDRADRHHGAGAEGPRRHEAAAGRAAVARRQARQRGRAVGLSERLPCLRGRDRSRHRRHRGREIHRGQRLRHHHQSDAGRRPDPRRRGAGHRPDAAGARRLRRAGPAPDRLVHGLRHAARAPHAELRGAEPSGAGHDQPARRQGLRRGRLRRLADLDHECGGRCAVGIRHQAHRHAGEPGAGLAGDPGREEDAQPSNAHRPSHKNDKR